MRVLNFYSAVFADQLRNGRKTATIRLGDKSHKYQKNELVLVTIGRKVALDDVVTVVRFSKIVENPPEIRSRMHGLGGAQN